MTPLLLDLSLAPLAPLSLGLQSSATTESESADMETDNTSSQPSTHLEHAPDTMIIIKSEINQKTLHHCVTRINFDKSLKCIRR